MTATLAWRMCAPIQFWGRPGNLHQDRPASPWPTHSAITGVIACAHGYERDDSRQLTISDRRQVIRIDNAGQMDTDCQIIADTINTAGARRGGGQVISNRGILHDACFVVFVSWTDAEVAHEAYIALRDPVWALRMGRIGAPFTPESLPTFIDGDFDDDTVSSWPPCPHHPPQDDTWKVVTAAQGWNPATVILDDSRLVDVPRRYETRLVTVTELERTAPAVPDEEEDLPLLQLSATGQLLLPGETDDRD